MNKSFVWGVVLGVVGTYVYHQVRPMKSASA